MAISLESLLVHGRTTSSKSATSVCKFLAYLLTHSIQEIESEDQILVQPFWQPSFLEEIGLVSGKLLQYCQICNIFLWVAFLKCSLIVNGNRRFSIFLQTFPLGHSGTLVIINS